MMMMILPIFDDRYPGGKSGAGIYQRIINQIPPHEFYIEGFLGGGAILRHKRSASFNLGIDLDPEIIAQWKAVKSIARNQKFEFLNIDFLSILARIDRFGYDPHKTFLYLDPPYLIETRRSSRPIYKFEMSKNDHIRLLDAIKNAPQKIALSGYPSALYDQALPDWRKIEFSSVVSSGESATESLWMNYPEPIRLHDYSYLGENFTDRQRIKRKAERFRNKILNLPPLERAAIIHAIDDIDRVNYETR